VPREARRLKITSACVGVCRGVGGCVGVRLGCRVVCLWVWGICGCMSACRCEDVRVWVGHARRMQARQARRMQLLDQCGGWTSSSPHPPSDLLACAGSLPCALFGRTPSPPCSTSSTKRTHWLACPAATLLSIPTERFLTHPRATSFLWNPTSIGQIDAGTHTRARSTHKDMHTPYSQHAVAVARPV
jgi:hypothetical protein